MLTLPVTIYHDGNRGDDYFLNERLYEDEHIFVGRNEEVTIMIRKSDNTCHGFLHDEQYYLDSHYYYMES